METNTKYPMTDVEIGEEAHKLIDLALPVHREGEDLDLTDREYTIEDIVRLKDTLSSMRSTIDLITRALAAYWLAEWGEGRSCNLNGQHYWLAPNKKWRIQPEQEEAFAEWLANQDVEKIARIVADIRVTPIGKAERDTFLTRETTSADLRIQRDRASGIYRGSL